MCKVLCKDSIALDRMAFLIDKEAVVFLWYHFI